MLISTFQQLLVIAVFVLPGFVFQAMRQRLRGLPPGDAEVFGRLLRALSLSGLLAVLYFIVFGQFVRGIVERPQEVLGNPVTFGFIALTLIYVIPGVLAVVDYGRYWFHRGRTRLNRREALRVTVRHLVSRDAFQFISPLPTAWDFIAQDPGIFVRVCTKDGRWVGGRLGRNAFINSSPQKREMYIEHPHIMGTDGSFGAPTERSRGVWLNCEDVILVEHLN